MKNKAKRNKTITLNREEEEIYGRRLLKIHKKVPVTEITDRTINQDLLELADFLPERFVDLLFIDPPYNLNKDFGETGFSKMRGKEYLKYLESWFPKLLKTLKKNASVYVCCDWRSTGAVYEIMDKYLTVRNRISWQREKGRGAKKNWKNCTEDIWFATVSDDYYFNVEAVKMKRRVLAPYKNDGKPKDWEETPEGNFRSTHPSNFWDDITVPYWSMAENTVHPTQKPEKLAAKLILASCPPNGFVFDPFCGSGTMLAAAKKLGRNYCGTDISREYCLLAEKRLALAGKDKTIQGYSGGVFWERNSQRYQKAGIKGK